MKVGIIGIGVIADMHLSSLLMAGESITALCDIETGRCDNAIKSYGLKDVKVYADYKQMIDEAGLDSVHVCTPHYLHCEMICYALKRGVNVLCEKPVAISFSELDEIEAAVKASSAKLAVCQQNRFRASFKFVKEYFGDRKITSASGTLCWQRDANYYKSGDWRGKMATEGGGVVINQALHTLDLLQWFCGMPTSVIGHISNDTLKGVVDVEESAFGIFKLPDGGRFILSSTNASSTSFPVTIMLASGTDTAIIIDDSVIINGELITKKDDIVLPGKAVWGVGHLIFIKEFYEALRTGGEVPLDFDEARKVILLLLSLYRSCGNEIIIKE